MLTPHTEVDETFVHLRSVGDDLDGGAIPRLLHLDRLELGLASITTMTGRRINNIPLAATEK